VSNSINPTVPANQQPNSTDSESRGTTNAKDQFVNAANEKREGGSDDLNEVDLWQGGYHPKAMFGGWLTCIAASIGIIVAAAMFEPLTWGIATVIIAILWTIAILRYAYFRLSVYYELTTQRLSHREGILKITTHRIEVIDIKDVVFTQGIVERIFGVGTIRVASSDLSHPSLTMFGIDDVRKVAGLIDDTRRKERKRRALHIESI
jgi:uncharacterized membrane protein YdbT with pleckstrin-like domain